MAGGVFILRWITPRRSRSILRTGGETPPELACGTAALQAGDRRSENFGTVILVAEKQRSRYSLTAVWQPLADFKKAKKSSTPRSSMANFSDCAGMFLVRPPMTASPFRVVACAR